MSGLAHWWAFQLSVTDADDHCVLCCILQSSEVRLGYSCFEFLYIFTIQLENYLERGKGTLREVPSGSDAVIR